MFLAQVLRAAVGVGGFAPCAKASAGAARRKAAASTARRELMFCIAGLFRYAGDPQACRARGRGSIPSSARPRPVRARTLSCAGRTHYAAVPGGAETMEPRRAALI